MGHRCGAILNKLIEELVAFIDPLLRAGESTAGLSQFLSQFGLNIPTNAITSVGNTLNDQNAINDLRTAISNLPLPPPANVDPELFVAVGTAATELYGKVSPLIDAISDNVTGLNQGNISQFAVDLTDDIFSYLIYAYLNRRVRTLTPILSALDVLQQTFIEADEAPGRGISYVEIRFHWGNLRDFVIDNESWARNSYGWGLDQDFDYIKALSSLGAIANQLGARARFMPLEAVDSAIAQNPTPESFKVQLPIFQTGGVPDVNGNLSAFAEAGFVVLPSGDIDTPAGLGLALAPYAEGGASINVDIIADRLKYKFDVAGQVVGGAYLLLDPDTGLGVGPDGGVDLEFTNKLEYKDKNNDPIILIGDAGATRLQIQDASIAVGGNMNGDFYIASGATGISFIINPGSDGLLSSVFSGEMIVDVGDIAMGWRASQGVYFEGGSNLGIIIPVDINLGPVNIYEFGVSLDFATSRVTLTTTLDLTLGPLYAYADGIGLSFQFVEREGGILGRHDVDVGFVPPTAYALALNAPPIEGGGLFERTDTGYRGALALNFQSIGFSAFGILDTELPGNQDGFSFAASIFAEFTIPLPFGFFLTGLGGIIGINRTVDTEALREVLYDGRLDNLLFPDDPIENAATILDDMASIFPADEGQHLFGPVVRISWGQPALVDVKLGVVLEIGDNYRLIILGGLSTHLPTKEAALVVLNITFFGEIDFGARTISFDATLVNSRILAFTISGDVAIRTGWADRLEHVASFGGLHPQFPKPSNLPDLRRITLNFGTNNPRVTVTAYTAITSNSLQFGGRAELYAKGPKIWLIGQLAAEGYVYLDALIYFQPFEFDVALGGGLNLLRNGSVALGLGFSLRLKGPNNYYINGKVWAKILKKKVKFDITHRWGSRQTITYDTVELSAKLRTALEGNKGFEPTPDSGRVTRVSFMSSDDIVGRVDPIGGIQFSQKVAPLNVSLQKFGKSQLVSTSNKVDIVVEDKNGNAVVTQSVTAEFVRGHFFNLSDSERLRATAFENHKSGFSISSAHLSSPSAKAIRTQYDYEYIQIPVNEALEDTPLLHPAMRNAAVSAQLLKRFKRSDHNIALQTKRVIADAKAFANTIKVSKPTYVTEVEFSGALDVVDTHSVGPVGQPSGGISAPGTDIRAELTNAGVGRPHLHDAYNQLSASEQTHNANALVQDYMLAAGMVF